MSRFLKGTASFVQAGKDAGKNSGFLPELPEVRGALLPNHFSNNVQYYSGRPMVEEAYQKEWDCDHMVMAAILPFSLPTLMLLCIEIQSCISF